MIVHGSAADVQLGGDVPGRAAFCQKAKNLDLSLAKVRLARLPPSSDLISYASGYRNQKNDANRLLCRRAKRSTRAIISDCAAS
jgi:hypothetical protein